MAVGWDTSGFPKPVNGTDDPDTVMSKVIDGLDAVSARYFGTTDPSSGSSWGADQRGREWLDSSGSEYNPVLKEWVRHNTGGTDYAFRKVTTRREFWVADPTVALTLPFTSPATADRAFEDVDILTAIRAVQDATFQLATPTEVLLGVTVTEAGTVTPTTAFVAFRKDGAAGDGERVKCQVSTMPVPQQVWVQVTAAGIFEMQTKVGSASPSLAVVLRLLAVREAVAA